MCMQITHVSIFKQAEHVQMVKLELKSMNGKTISISQFYPQRMKITLKSFLAGNEFLSHPQNIIIKMMRINN